MSTDVREGQKYWCQGAGCELTIEISRLEREPCFPLGLLGCLARLLLDLKQSKN